MHDSKIAMMLPPKPCTMYLRTGDGKCGNCGERHASQKPQPAAVPCSDLLSGQLEAACRLIGTIADCPYCFFGWKKEGCSDECNKFERNEGWECWKEYLAETDI